MIQDKVFKFWFEPIRDDMIKSYFLFGESIPISLRCNSRDLKLLQEYGCISEAINPLKANLWQENYYFTPKFVEIFIDGWDTID